MSDAVVYQLIQLFENNADSIQYANLAAKTNNKDLEVIASKISGILLQVEQLTQTGSVRLVCKNTIQNREDSGVPLSLSDMAGNDYDY